MEVDLQKKGLDQVMSCDRSLVEERILDLKFDSSLRPDYLKYFLFGSSAPLFLVTNHYQAFQMTEFLPLTWVNHLRVGFRPTETLKCSVFSGSPGNTPESTTKTFSSEQFVFAKNLWWNPPIG